MSNSIKHVWACPDLSFHRHWLYTFLHCLRSNFSLSRPLQLWFEAACETSFEGDIYAMQSTPKSLYSSSWMISVRDKISHVLTEQAWVRGVGIDFLLQSCCCWCYVIQPVHHVLHECVVGCPILSSMNAQVPINHRGVGIDLLYYSCSSLCYVIQPVYHVLHECVVGCPLLSTSKYEACPDQSSRRRHRF